jgi:TRAP-type mannitol/chloroaromatic compound transport system permease large subunit
VIFVGALLAATTGVVAASVISMGLISLPIMLRYGYDRRMASGVIAASGTLAQIIPPSLVLIILADQLGRSVGDMYKGAFVPGFMLTGCMCCTSSWPSSSPSMGCPRCRSKRAPPRRQRQQRPAFAAGADDHVHCGMSILWARTWPPCTPGGTGEAGRRWPLDETIVWPCAAAWPWPSSPQFNKVTRMGLLSRMAERVTFVLIPPLLLIFLVLGTIFLGVATPTEGGAMGAMGAIIMAMAAPRLSFDAAQAGAGTTTKLSCFVVFILVGATMFSLVFQGVDGPKWVEHLLAGLPGGQVGFLIVVNIMIFFLAFFLDFFELSFIVVPLLAPVADKLGIDLIWFGVLLA